MAIYRGPGGSGDATTDAANEASVASDKAAQAASSATAAAGSATSSATSASDSSTSAIASASSATSSANSATASASSATAAASSATAAAASFDSFDDRYLGAKSSAPTTDNDGNALAEGAMYYDTVDDIIYVWNGTTWQTITTGSGGLEAANNLSDVASASTSRTNLGLGTTDSPTFNGISVGSFGGSPKFQVDPNSNSVTVNSNLSIDGSVSSTGSLTLSDNLNAISPDITFISSGYANYTLKDDTGDFKITSGVSPTAKFIILDNNNVGINTNTPAEKLDVSGNIAVSGTVDGRDVAADGTKLDGIETAATADQTGAQIKTAYEAETNAFTDAQFTKLAGIETAADVTDGTNVTAAGALMDSEVTNLAQVKAFDSSDYVAKTSATGSAVMPSGTTAQRNGSPNAGNLRFNTTDTSFEGYDGSAWGAIGGGGGASGGGSDAIFYENGQTITTSYSITASTNAMSTGPLTVNSGVSVTVPSGSRWVVL